MLEMGIYGVMEKDKSQGKGGTFAPCLRRQQVDWLRLAKQEKAWKLLLNE